MQAMKLSGVTRSFLTACQMFIRSDDLQLMYGSILSLEKEKQERIRAPEVLRYHKSVKRSLAFFVLSGLLLLSCSPASGSESASSLEDGSFPLENNGDIASRSDASEYEDVCLQESASRLIERMEGGESVAFLFTSTECSHCLSWKSTFVSFLRDNPYGVALFENGLLSQANYNAMTGALKTYLGSTDKNWSATPQLYVAQKGSYRFLGAAGLTYQSLAASFKALHASSAITSFRNYSAYAAYQAKNPSALTFLKDDAAGGTAESFYASSLYPLAKNANKPLAILDYSAMDEANQSATLGGLGLSAYAPTLREGTNNYDLSKESEAADATSLLHDYYR
jgi:hypothetical protein